MKQLEENNEQINAVTLNENQIKELEQLSSLGWMPERIAKYLNIPKKDFLYALENDEDVIGTVKYHYNRGEIIASGKVDISLLNAAIKGNVTAIQIYEKKTQQNKLEKFKEDLLNGNK